MSDRVELTAEEAIAMLPDGETVHTFRGGGMLLLGADWDRAEILELIRNHLCELAGPGATAMGHGLYVHDGSGLFVATRGEPEQ